MRPPSTLDELQALIDRLGVDLPMSDDLSPLGDPVKIGDRTTPNRFVALPMEGCDCAADGTPGELTFRRYERMAAGGAGVLWFEACAVEPEGRSNPSALFLHQDNLDVFKKLVEQTRQAAREAMGHEVICIVQLTHAGRYCKPQGEPRPVVARRCPELDAAQQLPDDYPLVTDEKIDQLQDAYVRTAALAEAAGFDGVDVKACHGYFVSSLLAAHLRPGRYGGEYENRTRFLKETIALIQDRRPSLLVTTRLNLFDGMAYPHGFGTSRTDAGVPDMEEPVRLVKELGARGMPLLNVSMGYPRFDPHFGRPASDTKEEHPLVGIARFVSLVREAQRAVPKVPTVVGALAWLGRHMPQAAAGLVQTGAAQLIGQGRGSIAYPDSVRDILEKGELSPKKICVACSMCSQLLRAGRPCGCVARDKSIYAAEWKQIH